MAEEKTNTPAITNDDINALRILLHNVKGLSVVSTIPDLTQEEVKE